MFISSNLVIKLYFDIGEDGANTLAMEETNGT